MYSIVCFVYFFSVCMTTYRAIFELFVLLMVTLACFCLKKKGHVFILTGLECLKSAFRVKL